MEVNNCTDINGVGLNEVTFNVDGTVVGILEDGESNLSYQCCVDNGWTFDPTDTKCYWSPSCIDGGSYNVILNPESDTGAIFQLDEGEEERCVLELNFDWLLKFECSRISNNTNDNRTLTLSELLEDIELTVKIEKVITNNSLPIPNTTENVISKTLFATDDVSEFFNGNERTGILLEGAGSRECTSVRQTFIDELGSNIDENSINSEWAKFNLVIDDLSLINDIRDERVKISIEGNSLRNFSLLIDNVKLDKVCDSIAPPPPRFVDGDCPTFEITRVIDNKKSWVRNNELINRNFDLDRRKTNYRINNERLSINTKEVDIAINPSQAVNDNIFSVITENPCLLSASTECESNLKNVHQCVDISNLITVPLTEITNDSELFNMLIDAKNRKTISGYPTLELINYRYNNSVEHCGVSTESLDGDSLDEFVKLIGDYWIDLIEQVVPATTIWGSSIYSDNALLSSGNNKFKYRKYSTFTCNTRPSFKAPSPVSGVSYNYGGSVVNELPIDVNVEDITNINPNSTGEPTFGAVEDNSYDCTGLTLIQTNNGSEFIGTVTTIGGDEDTVSGSTISITETITDECDKYEDC
jgi:hypothetical protein